MTSLIADTHVHLHDLFPVPGFLSAAVENLKSLSGSETTERALFFVDMPGQDAFARLRTESEGWQVEEQGTWMTLTRNSDGSVLHAFAGHQVVSEEGLEVLGLDCRIPKPESGMPLLDLIERMKEAGGIPLLPWGVGKWSGSRSRVIQSLAGGRKDLRFADNGNRLTGSPLPATLRYVQDHQGFPLAGSDPLPLESHESRAGTYACRWKTDASGTVQEQFRTVLTQPVPVQWCGTLTSPVQFALDQVIMQRNKHLPWLKR